MVTPGQLARRAEFFQQLAAMIAAGVSLPKALEMVGRNRVAGVSQKTVHALTQHLNNGHTFTDAMRLVSGQMRPEPGSADDLKFRASRNCWLSDFDIALLSAGEQSGQLDSAFKLLARYSESRARIIRETITSLFFTVLTLHVFLLVMPLGLLVKAFLGLYNSQYAECIPFIIEKIIVYGSLYGVVWFLFFATQGNRGSGWQSVVESIYAIFPWLRVAVKYLAVARLAMALESLLNAGVPVVRAWELAAVSSGSSKLKREILRLTPQLETGLTPGEMVAQIPYFPEMFTHLYQTGELSGRLDESLTRLHTYFEEEGFRKLRTFFRVSNMVLYFTIVACVGYFIVNFWTNYYRQMLNSF
jgi:type II secretory pathway component PulF